MQNEDSGHGLVHRTADNITMRIPRWLWDKRIPVGHMTLLAGREGIGKSSIALMLVAKITRGTLDGEYLGTPKGVAIVATEDDWGSTIAPRLLAAGADLSKVYQIEAHREGRLETISVPHDVHALGSLCQTLDIVLLVVDPVMSVLPGNIDTHKDREVRKVLEPMAKHFAQNYGVAVVGLIHANKSSSSDALNTIMGSRAFTALSRSVLFCSSDPDDDDTYLLGHVKSNLGPKTDTFTYRLVEAKVEIQEEGKEHPSVVTMSRAVLGDTDDRTISEVLVEKANVRPEGSLSKELVRFIEEFGGAVQMSQIAREFKKEEERKLAVYLGRLVKRGRIDRPSMGVYQSIKKSPKRTPETTQPNTPPNTILNVVSVGYVGEAPTHTTDATYQHVRGGVGQHVEPDAWPVVPPPDGDDGPPEWD